MEWISVEDRLPEENGVYLIYNNAEIAFGTYYKRFSGFLVEPLLGKQIVTHWMPLPEPPAKSYAAWFGDVQNGASIDIRIEVSDRSLPLSEFEDRVYKIFARAMNELKREWSDDD